MIVVYGSVDACGVSNESSISLARQWNCVLRDVMTLLLQSSRMWPSASMASRKRQNLHTRHSRRTAVLLGSRLRASIASGWSPLVMSFMIALRSSAIPTSVRYGRVARTIPDGPRLSKRAVNLSDVESDDYSESARSYELGKVSDFACARPRPDFSAFLCLWRKVTIGWEMRPVRLVLQNIRNFFFAKRMVPPFY